MCACVSLLVFSSVCLIVLFRCFARLYLLLWNAVFPLRLLLLCVRVVCVCRSLYVSLCLSRTPWRWLYVCESSMYMLCVCVRVSVCVSVGVQDHAYASVWSWDYDCANNLCDLCRCEHFFNMSKKGLCFACLVLEHLFCSSLCLLFFVFSLSFHIRISFISLFVDWIP